MMLHGFMTGGWRKVLEDVGHVALGFIAPELLLWAREAISGTTPPNSACRSTWEDTTLDTTSDPPMTTAAAVSSQLVSIPSTSVESSISFMASAS